MMFKLFVNAYYMPFNVYTMFYVLYARYKKFFFILFRLPLLRTGVGISHSSASLSISMTGWLAHRFFDSSPKNNLFYPGSTPAAY